MTQSIFGGLKGETTCSSSRALQRIFQAKDVGPEREIERGVEWRGDVITGRNQKAPGSSCASHPDLGETQTPEVSSAEILSPYGQPIPAMEECERNHPDTRK